MEQETRVWKPRKEASKERGESSTHRRVDETGMLPGSGVAGLGVPGRVSAVANKVGLNFGGTGEAICVIHVFCKGGEEECVHKALSYHSRKLSGIYTLAVKGSPNM